MDPWKVSAMQLSELGYGSWYETSSSDAQDDGAVPARVTGVHKDSFIIHDGHAEIRAELTGKLLYGARSPLDLPTVGDWVRVQILDNGDFAIIQAVSSRKSLLKRKTPGKQVEHQLIAANLDAAFIMQSLGPDFNLRRLERYLVMVCDGGMHPVLLLSKMDLAAPQEVEEKVRQANRVQPGLEIVPFSNLEGRGVDAVRAIMKPGHTYCLLGSSGVGKTTLLNNLLGSQTLETREVRAKGGKGRHTTTRRALIMLAGGAMVIDTPGLRELGSIEADEGLEQVFDDIQGLAENCRFSDCSHTTELGCAVLEALQTGEVDEKRYQNFLRLTRETARNQMSYHEKRRQDKEFGKMCKSIMKGSLKNPG